MNTFFIDILLMQFSFFNKTSQKIGKKSSIVWLVVILQNKKNVCREKI